MDPPCSTRVSRDRVYSRAHQLPATGLSPSVARISILFAVPLIDPRSLAATDGIAVAFFSCAYLDVSVLHVRSSPLCIQSEVSQRDGLPHSDIFGSQLVYQLPEAFRRLPRPSSPLDAKTFTVCPYGLATPNSRRDLTSSPCGDSITPLPPHADKSVWPADVQFNHFQPSSTRC